MNTSNLQYRAVTHHTNELEGRGVSQNSLLYRLASCDDVVFRGIFLDRGRPLATETSEGETQAGGEGTLCAH